jgi:iron complex transport system substrate-binding protein
VLALADRENILRVSEGATSAFSYMREQARGLPTVRAVAEDVLVLQPDLVVRSYGGGPRAGAFLQQAGIPVLQLDYASDIGAIRRNVMNIAEGLGVPGRGMALVADMDNRLAVAAATSNGHDALYLTPGGVTAGPGTLVDELLEAAGLGNFQRTPGWHPIPLERLAYESPSLLALAFFDADEGRMNAWSPAHHPLARQRMRELPGARLQGAWVACGGWFLVEAVEALVSATAAGSLPAVQR